MKKVFKHILTWWVSWLILFGMALIDIFVKTNLTDAVTSWLIWAGCFLYIAYATYRDYLKKELKELKELQNGLGFCDKPPAGWYCVEKKGHKDFCFAVNDLEYGNHFRQELIKHNEEKLKRAEGVQYDGKRLYEGYGSYEYVGSRFNCTCGKGPGGDRNRS